MVRKIGLLLIMIGLLIVVVPAKAKMVIDLREQVDGTFTAGGGTAET